MPKAKKVMPATLRQKMAAATTGTRPSLLPAGVGGRPVEPPKVVDAAVEEPVPEINEIMEAGTDRTNLRKMVERHWQINSQIKKLESDLEPIAAAIKALLGDYGISKMTCDGAPVNYFVNARKTIKDTLLLAAGITQETIDTCTVTTNSKSLVIRPPKS
jgi:hypothetical protein